MTDTQGQTVNLPKLHNKTVNVAFRAVQGAQGAQGFVMMSGILTETSPDYVCLQTGSSKGQTRDMYIPSDMIAFIDATPDVIRASSNILS